MMPTRFSAHAIALSLAATILAASPLATPGASAAVVESGKTVDDLIIYVGVVPAAVTRAHLREHTGEASATSARRAGLHDIHVVAAIFSKASGQRLRKLDVTANVVGKRSRWAIPLRPMTVNGALTYGGFTSMGVVDEVSITIEVRRPTSHKHPRLSRATFDYEQD